MGSEEIVKLVQEISKNPYFMTTLYCALIPLVKITTGYKLKRNNKVKNCKVIYETDALKTIRRERTNPISKEIEDLIYESLTKLTLDVSPESMKIIKKIYPVLMMNQTI